MKYWEMTGIDPSSGLQRYGRWQVVPGPTYTRNRQTYVPCVCDCGTQRDVVLSTLNRGRSKSCGCATWCRYQQPKPIIRLDTRQTYNSVWAAAREIRQQASTSDRIETVVAAIARAAKRTGSAYGCGPWKFVS